MLLILCRCRDPGAVHTATTPYAQHSLHLVLLRGLTSFKSVQMFLTKHSLKLTSNFNILSHENAVYLYTLTANNYDTSFTAFSDDLKIPHLPVIFETISLKTVSQKYICYIVFLFFYILSFCNVVASLFDHCLPLKLLIIVIVVD